MLGTIMLCAALNATPAGNETINVFMGDSRTVGMERSVEDKENEVYLCKGSMGYDYLVNTAWPEFEETVEENPEKEINAVINFGVNDLKNEEKYAAFINEEIKDLPKNVHISWASVNPTNGSYERMTDRIERFNDSIRDDLVDSIGYIDSYTYLMENGYSSFDGLHYGKETNCKIHDYFVEEMDKKAADDKDAPKKMTIINIKL